MLRIQKFGNISTNVDTASRRWHILFANTEEGLVKGPAKHPKGVPWQVGSQFFRLTITCSNCEQWPFSCFIPMSHSMHTLPSYNKGEGGKICSSLITYTILSIMAACAVTLTGNHWKKKKSICINSPYYRSEIDFPDILSRVSFC